MNKDILTAKDPKQIVWCNQCNDYLGFIEDLWTDDEGRITCPKCHKDTALIFSSVRWRPPEQSDLPKRWECIKRSDFHPLYGFYRFSNKLAAAMSIDIINRYDVWLHVSASYRDHVPSYDDLICVKRIFIGDNNDAYHAFPRKSHHINLHPFCLHLWHCMTGPTMPDFRITENLI